LLSIIFVVLFLIDPCKYNKENRKLLDCNIDWLRLSKNFKLIFVVKGQ
jgi:hypothetical protein